MGIEATSGIWEECHRENPLGTITLLKGAEATPENLFRHGRSTVAMILSRAHEKGISVRRGRALDFGCGLGRLTQALGDEFDEVVGVDVAPSAIRNCAAYNRHGERVRYVLNSRPDLAVFGDGSFDFVLSDITLQHVPPPDALAYVREFVRVLRPGGVAVFEAPSEFPRVGPAWRGWAKRLLPARVLRAYRKARYGFAHPPTPVFGLPREEVLGALREAGAEVLFVEERAKRSGPVVCWYWVAKSSRA